MRRIFDRQETASRQNHGRSRTFGNRQTGTLASSCGGSRPGVPVDGRQVVWRTRRSPTRPARLAGPRRHHSSPPEITRLDQRPISATPNASPTSSVRTSTSQLPGLIEPRSNTFPEKTRVEHAGHDAPGGRKRASAPGARLLYEEGGSQQKTAHQLVIEYEHDRPPDTPATPDFSNHEAECQ